MSVLTVFVLILAIAVIYLFKEQAANQKNTKESSHAPSKPEPPKVAKEEKKPKPVDEVPEATPHTAETVPPIQTVDPALESEAQSPDPNRNEGIETPKKRWPGKWKKPPEKKSSPTLLNSPY